MTCVVAIDPGVDVAWAAINNFAEIGELVIDCGELEGIQGWVNGHELHKLLRTLKPSQAVIENVHSMKGQGLASTFKFGRAVGYIHGIVAGLGIPIFMAEPSRWKKYHRLINKDKEAGRLMAVQRWPDLAGKLAMKGDHGKADALLIADWWNNGAG